MNMIIHPSKLGKESCRFLLRHVHNHRYRNLPRINLLRLLIDPARLFSADSTVSYSDELITNRITYDKLASCFQFGSSLDSLLYFRYLILCSMY